MKIAHFYRDYLCPGGMPRETKLLAEAMARRLDGVYVYCYTADPSEEGACRHGGVTVRRFYWPRRFWNRNAFALPLRLEEILRSNTDGLSAVILTGTFIPENFSLARLLVRIGIPYVVSIGDGFNPYLFGGLRGVKKRLYTRLFERRILRDSLALRLYSAIQVEHLKRGGLGDDWEFFVIKEGVDWEAIRAECGVAFGDLVVDSHPIHRREGWPRFGFLGRISVYSKGLDLLVRAWADYEAKGGIGRLSIVGAGSAAEIRELVSLCHRLRAARVELLPPKYGLEKFNFLHDLDALVHPSRHEGIPRVLREAFAMGCPVIVTNGTNLHDLVLEVGAGFVVNPDPPAIASALREFARLGSIQWERLRRGARQAAQVLDWDIIAAKYISECEGLGQPIGSDFGLAQRHQEYLP